jgi:hypothetical protein
MEHGRARPVPEDIAQLESTELRVIWEYVGYDPPLNYRRTLDQFAYPSLRDTYARDDDQMLYKLTKESTPSSPYQLMPGRNPLKTAGSGVGSKFGKSPVSTGLHSKQDDSDSSDDEDGEDLDETIKDGKVLMIDQLWLWAIDTSESGVDFFLGLPFE